MNLEEATMEALQGKLTESKSEVLNALKIIKPFVEEISVNTLVGESSIEIAMEIGYDIEDDEIIEAIDRIQEHIWVYDEEDEEWFTNSDNDELPENVKIIELDPEDYGYSKVATDIPEIFDVISVE